MIQPDPLFAVTGKVIVVTGGGGVLPGALALGLAARGARIVLVNRTLDKAERVAAEIRSHGGEALALRADVTQRTELEAAAAVVSTHYHGVDHLINGAGGNRPGATLPHAADFFGLSEGTLHEVFALNFYGAVLSAQVFGSLIKKEPGGSILNLSSMAATRPLTRVIAYGAAKAALENFTRWLAVALARENPPGIRVNAVAPGFFLGTQNRTMLLDANGEPTERGRSILAHTPQGRFGAPEDLLGAVVWLLSPGAAFVTGAVVPVDGGFSAFSGV